MTHTDAKKTGANNVENPPREKGTWARTITLIALILSALLSVIYFLNPVWEFSDAVEAFFGGSGDGSALFLLYLLTLLALILDIVVIGLTFAVVQKNHRRSNLIMCVIAIVAASAPLALGAV